MHEDPPPLRLLDYPLSHRLFDEPCHLRLGLLLGALRDTYQRIERAWGGRERVEFEEVAVFDGYRYEGRGGARGRECTGGGRGDECA